MAKNWNIAKLDFCVFPQLFYIMSQKNEIAPFSICPTWFLEIVPPSRYYTQQKNSPRFLLTHKNVKTSPSTLCDPNQFHVQENPSVNTFKDIRKVLCLFQSGQSSLLGGLNVSGQWNNICAKSLINNQIRLFPNFRLFPTFRLFDSTALVFTVFYRHFP